MDIEKTFQTISDRCKQNQMAFDRDYRDGNGLLVCGVCGGMKETIINLPSLTAGGERKTMKVSCICKCQKEAIQKKEEQMKMTEESIKVRKLRAASLIDSKFRDASFDRFRVTKDNSDIYEKCRKYAEDFNRMLKDNSGLLMWGDVGTGKSFAAACIANYLMDRNVPVVMTSFVRLLEICKDKDRENEIINQLQSAKLVIFDDLGAERNSDYTLEKTYNFLDRRYRSGMPMIVTTNLTLNSMMKETDERFKRIYDRIYEVCYPLKFTGVSWRKRQASSKMESMNAFFEEKR